MLADALRASVDERKDKPWCNDDVSRIDKRKRERGRKEGREKEIERSPTSSIA